MSSCRLLREGAETSILLRPRALTWARKSLAGLPHRTRCGAFPKEGRLVCDDVVGLSRLTFKGSFVYRERNMKLLKKPGKTKTEAEKKKKKRTKPPVPPLEVLRNAELLPVDYFARIEPGFSPDSLRWLLFNRDQNGLAASGAIAQIGRRLLIDPKRFRDWARSGTPKS